MKSKAAAEPRPTRTTIKRKTRSCGLPRPGQKCPHCRTGRLDYDGLLNLVCAYCGEVAFTGGFT